MTGKLDVPADQTTEAIEEQIARLRGERDAARQALADQRHERFKADIRVAVTWLHSRAATMNDPPARAVLDVAASDLAADLAAGQLKAGAGTAGGSR